MLTPLDLTILFVYLLGVAWFGIRVGGKQTSTNDYFLGGRDLPWWAVCFSVVATETSTLTVIGVPAIAYFGTWTFLQITFGYLIGRLIVGLYFLPRYFEGELSTAYAFLGQRFGAKTQATASVTFLITRLLADGVRLFATAIPLKVILDVMGFDVSYGVIIVGIGLVTIAYTLIGGIKAVVWMDVVQMGLYVGGALLSVGFLISALEPGWWSAAAEAGKTKLFDVELGRPMGEWLTMPYALITAVVGGAFFGMASHGTDHLIVQRLLTCRTLADSRKALYGSAFAVMFQFALFLFVGTLLWAYYDGATLDMLGVGRGDEIYPKYIIEGLPAGLSGLLLAGIIAAAMSTLSSSLNALASSTMIDLYERFATKTLDAAKGLRLSRGFTLFWGIVFMGFASLFEDRQNPVVELGLSIASFTYGGLLGLFLLGLGNARARQSEAIVALLVSVVAMVVLYLGAWHGVDGWVWLWRPGAEQIAANELTRIGWPWFAVIGTATAYLIGSLLALRHPSR
ncbi:MAG: sodium:solute symporter [Rhodothermales bacterium]